MAYCPEPTYLNLSWKQEPSFLAFVASWKWQSVVGSRVLVSPRHSQHGTGTGAGAGLAAGAPEKQSLMTLFKSEGSDTASRPVAVASAAPKSHTVVWSGHSSYFSYWASCVRTGARVSWALSLPPACLAPSPCSALVRACACADPDKVPWVLRVGSATRSRGPVQAYSHWLCGSLNFLLSVIGLAVASQAQSWV